jgi:hypothetical protein
MPLTPEQAFKVGFLVRCADEGLTPEEIAERVKAASAMEKLSFIFPLMTGAATAAGSFIGGLPGKALQFAGALAPAAGVAAVGAPVLAGAGLGYLGAKATASDSDDLEQAKQDEIEGEYYRLSQEARRNAARKKLQARLGRKVTLLSPSLS